jgi:hypothetical protein
MIPEANKVTMTLRPDLIQEAFDGCPEILRVPVQRGLETFRDVRRPQRHQNVAVPIVFHAVGKFPPVPALIVPSPEEKNGVPALIDFRIAGGVQPESFILPMPEISNQFLPQLRIRMDDEDLLPLIVHNPPSEWSYAIKTITAKAVNSPAVTYLTAAPFVLNMPASLTADTPLYDTPNTIRSGMINAVL